MKTGLHTVNFMNRTSEWNTETAVAYIKSTAASDVSIFEILFARHLDWLAIKAAAEASAVLPIIGVVLTTPYDLIADDASIRGAAVDYLLDAVRAAETVGSTMVCGVLHSACAKRAPVSEVHWQRGIHGLRIVAKEAALRGITLAIEPVNRAEGSFINTIDQGLELCRRISEPNVGVQLDTFHGNIEEKDMAAAIRRAGSSLKYFHLCENDRGIIGTGSIDFDAIYQALSEIHYDGPVVLESFADLPGEPRMYAESPQALIAGSVPVMKALEHKYAWTASRSTV